MNDAVSYTHLDVYKRQARDTNNNELSLTYYEDNGELEIKLKKLGQSEASTSTSSSNSTNASSNFKDMMDSYEKFIDEYIAFMKKYNNSSDTTAMLSLIHILSSFL